MDAIYYGGVSVLQRKHVTKLAIHNKNTYTIINQGILIISKGGNNKGRGTKEKKTIQNTIAIAAKESVTRVCARV